MELTLEQFAQDFQQDVLATAEIEDSEDFAENAFSRRMLEYIAEAGELGDAEVCNYRGGGLKLNGYELNAEEESLDVSVAIYTGKVPPVRVEKARVDQVVRQVTAFVRRSIEGLHAKIEEAHPAFAAAQAIHRFCAENGTFARIRVFVLSDGIVNVERLPEIEDLGGASASLQVWDIERLFRWFSSGHQLEEIEVDFSQHGGPIDCIPVAAEGADYDTYLAAIPANTLVSIYGRYGPRLLERNVRSFLQLKGSVNKGIRTTLLSQPQRFLAYNNGITVTAMDVRTAVDKAGRTVITFARDLQIVNGGQTTASLYRAARKDGADLAEVRVPMKLSVVRDPGRLDDFVAEISRYANSQNKVSVADLSANDPFHRCMEELSRTTWAPAAGGMQRQTRWFYERARGQYADARAREGTPARIRTFDQMHPRSQMFTKTDLAKFENTWMQKPHIVSKGAQKNFLAFAEELGRRGGFVPDLQYFQDMVAKAILFRQAERIVHRQTFGGYRANIVTYTIALVAHLTGQRIDLDRIWYAQALTPAIESAIENFCVRVHGVITVPPGGKNVTEWCKMEDCWSKCTGLDVSVPRDLEQELIRHVGAERAVNRGIEQPDEADLANIARVKAIPGESWFRLAKWAKDTRNLMPWQRGLAFSLGRAVSSNREPTRKQALHGLQIWEEATRLGFRA